MGSCGGASRLLAHVCGELSTDCTVDRAFKTGRPVELPEDARALAVTISFLFCFSFRGLAVCVLLCLVQFSG